MQAKLISWRKIRQIWIRKNSSLKSINVNLPLLPQLPADFAPIQLQLQFPALTIPPGQCAEDIICIPATGEGRNTSTGMDP